MVIAWKVVAVDTNGTQMVVDEGLTQERALQIADTMLTKGNSVIIQAEPTDWLPQITSISNVWPTGRVFPRRPR